ncbi:MULTISPECIES: hypothetical protein [unclassified Streptomyces]|uniref:hypothetical protein n=1 Tax=unclassified Streptomyces TaxID=2593676 RepID=UPI00380FC0BC
MPDPNEGRSKWDRVGNPFGELIAKTPAARRWQLLLAQVAAAYEQQAMGDQAWRGGIDSMTAAWLRFLQGEGYALSEIEEQTLAAADAQKAERAAKASVGDAEQDAA